MFRNTPNVVVVLLALLAPAAVAHWPPGSPKNYCEDPIEWSTHEYASPATGLPTLMLEGNQAEDCNADTIPGDYDSHAEFTSGGAWLAAETGDFTTTGSAFCMGEVAHHEQFGPFLVVDAALGSAAPFTVWADSVDLLPSSRADRCGDFVADERADCVGSCRVTFPPGLDGAYHVDVGAALGGIVGSFGHICNPFCDPGRLSTECADGFDNDSDGRYDYPNDPECADFGDGSEAA